MMMAKKAKAAIRPKYLHFPKDVIVHFDLNYFTGVKKLTPPNQWASSENVGNQSAQKVIERKSRKSTLKISGEGGKFEKFEFRFRHTLLRLTTPNMPQCSKGNDQL